MEKELTKKSNKLYMKWNGDDNSLNSRNKYIKMSYFPEPYTHSERFSNYATKSNSKKQQGLLIHRKLLKELI